MFGEGIDRRSGVMTYKQKVNKRYFRRRFFDSRAGVMRRNRSGIGVRCRTECWAGRESWCGRESGVGSRCWASVSFKFRFVCGSNNV